MWYTIYANKRLRPNPERDAKYAPFVRYDYDQWSYTLAIFTHAFFLPRMVIGWFSFMLLGVIGMILCYGEDPKNLPQWKKKTIVSISVIVGNLIALSSGIYTRRKRIHVDYSKYLGKDYAYTYDGAGMHIINHQNGLDVVLQYITQVPLVSLLGKREALSIPGCKNLVEPLQLLLVGRDTKDSKDVRNQLLDDIKNRQLAAEKGEAAPLLIFPEGATSNGRSVLQFKRGAFLSLRPIKPHYSKSWSLTGLNPSHGDPSSMLGYINVLVECGLTICTVHEMPVFAPNDFFWRNHWDGKEEKWVAYARAVRQIIIEQGGFEDTQCDLNDKVAYKQIVRGKKVVDKVS